jgi:hypothetical protein
VTEPTWITTEAIVTTCRYQSPGLSILAFGFQTGEKFLITFDYYAHGQLYSGEFQSPTAIPQNEHIPIAYNPLAPQRNTRSASSSTTRTPLFVIAVAGSVVISILYFALLHSCN